MKPAAGTPAETLELAGPCPARDVVPLLAERHGDPLRRLLLDADGRVRPTILVFVGDEQVVPEQDVTLRDGDTVTLMTPLAGG